MKTLYESILDNDFVGADIKDPKLLWATLRENCTRFNYGFNPRNAVRAVLTKYQSFEGLPPKYFDLFEAYIKTQCKKINGTLTREDIESRLLKDDDVIVYIEHDTDSGHSHKVSIFEFLNDSKHGEDGVGYYMECTYYKPPLTGGLDVEVYFEAPRSTFINLASGLCTQYEWRSKPGTLFTMKADTFTKLTAALSSTQKLSLKGLKS